VATALAGVLGSAEAVLLSADDEAVPVPAPEIIAAADIAEHVLRTVGDAYDEAAELLEGAADLAVAAPAPGRFTSAWF
jgi:methylmalonyl-CoA mutase N-terminal domain/subunit